MLTFTHTLFAMLLAVAAAPNPHFTKYIGTWNCVPRTAAGERAFQLTIYPIDGTTLGLQGYNVYPGNGTASWHTLRRSEDGEWTIDLHLVPFPYSGRPDGDGTIDFARTPPNVDRLFWQISPNAQTLQFSLYKTTDLPIMRINHMVTCQRT